MEKPILFIGMFILSVILTYFLRAYSLRKNIIDIPNSRSSHTLPTPRGGGVSIVISFLLILGYMEIWFGFLAGLLVAVIGWLDDHGHVDSNIRLAVHFAASSLIVYSVGGLPVIYVFGNEVYLGLIGSILSVIGLVWILNLYNFMDGIDGIASVEILTSAGSAGFILWYVYGMNETDF